MVRDVGFICLLTRCRSGLARMVATSGGYRPGTHSVLLRDGEAEGRPRMVPIVAPAASDGLPYPPEDPIKTRAQDRQIHGLPPRKTIN